MKNIGIVGVGGFAATILRSILRVESEGLAHLEGAVIRNPAKYPEAISRLKAEERNIYVSLADMLERSRGKLDIVSIPTGIPSHRDLAVQALEAGCHVVLEKPVAAAVQEVDDIVAAGRRSGRFCAIGYQHIHTAAMQTLREEIENGHLGRIKWLKTYALWPRNRTYYTRNPWAGQLVYEGHWVLDGPVTNACAHFLNNMFYLLNAQSGGHDPIVSLQAELYRANAIPTYDTVCLRAQMASGVPVYIVLTHAVAVNEDPVTEIEAENASAVWTYAGARVVIRYKDGVVRTVEGEGNDSHAQVFRDAIAVAEGRRPRPLFTAADGRDHVLAVNLAFESSGGIVDIPADKHRVVALPGGDQRTEVEGLEEIVRQAFREMKLFSELGVPWARPGEEVSAEGYDAFPRSERLRTYFQDLIGWT